MSEFICKIDNSKHESLNSLHRYLCKFKIKVADYYEEYYPRYDLGTEEKISYKSYDQYFNQDFLNRNTLKKFIKNKPEDAKKWAIDWLKKRKDKKKSIYPYSQVELKSLVCPTMNFYDFIGGYYGICEELGFTKKFGDEELKFKKLPKDTVIITDTREQKPLKFPYKTKKGTVNCGDYAIDGEKNKNIYIERKSLNDFIGTLSLKNLDRFDRELERAKNQDFYIVMVVEQSLSKSLSFNYIPHIKRYTKISPDHIFKNLRDLMDKYALNFQVLFVESRVEAVEKIIKIFELGDQVKSVDLQYRYEKGDI